VVTNLEAGARGALRERGWLPKALEMIESIVHKSELRPMMRTIEFVYYLFWIGVLIGALHLADVRPWAERMALIGWPILIAVSVWFIGSYLPTRRGRRRSD